MSKYTDSLISFVAKAKGSGFCRLADVHFLSKKGIKRKLPCDTGPGSIECHACIFEETHKIKPIVQIIQTDKIK